MYPQLSDDDIRSTSMGAGGEDVQMSSAARRLIPFSFEAKNQERVNVWDAMDQCRANAPSNVDPVVVMKKNQQKPHVLVSWDCFKRLIARPSASAPPTSRALLLEMATELQRIAATMENSE